MEKIVKKLAKKLLLWLAVCGYLAMIPYAYQEHKRYQVAKYPNLGWRNVDRNFTILFSILWPISLPQLYAVQSDWLSQEASW